MNICKFILEVGERVKCLRVNQGYSQDEFSTLVGWDKSYLCRVECGKQNLTLENIAKVCSALKITPKDFFMPIDYQIEGRENNNA